MGMRLLLASSAAALVILGAAPVLADPELDPSADVQREAGVPDAGVSDFNQVREERRRSRPGPLLEQELRRDRAPPPPPPVIAAPAVPAPEAARVVPAQSSGVAGRAVESVLRGEGRRDDDRDHRNRDRDGRDHDRRDDDRRDWDRRDHDRRDWDRRDHDRRDWDRRDHDRRDDWSRRDWRDPRWGDRSWQDHYGRQGWRRDWYDQRWSGGWDGTWGYGYQAWRFPGWGWNQGWTPGWNSHREPPNSHRGFYNNGGVWVPSPWVWDRASRGARRYPVLVFRSWRDPRPDVRLDRSSRVYWLADRAEWVFLRGVNRRYWYDWDRSAYYTRDDDGTLILLAVAPRDIGLGYALTVGGGSRY
jgi:hypothetical protein